MEIDGIGGAFIFSNNPKKLAEWYTRMLGLDFKGGGDFGAYYQVFWACDPENTYRKVDTTFAIMQAKTTIERKLPDTEPKSMYGDQPFMVNFRVVDLDGLLNRLQERGVLPLKREDESYGKFAWIRDLDGNRVELYEPHGPASS